MIAVENTLGDESPKLRICLVGAAHLCSNPRLVREADSLFSRGCDVRVVTPSLTDAGRRGDKEILKTRRWRHQPVPAFASNPLSRPGFARLRRKAATNLFRALPSDYLAERSSLSAYPEILKQATSEAADWYIAHTQPALPVAVRAARAVKAKVGFDCEDLLALSGTDPQDIILRLERTYLKNCDYVSVPTQLMGDELVRQYGIRYPIVLPNVFPISLAAGMTPPAARASDKPLRLHWFSQTIGPNRGLETAVKALSLMNGYAELHLRGNIASGYQETLRALASAHSVDHQLFILPLLPHDELIRSMESFDVGLALEQPANRNYSITVTNKVFSYLLAGLAIAATDTLGQCQALRQFPAAGFTFPAPDAAALAAGLMRFVEDPAALLVAKKSAWDCARNHFCWDRFECVFIDTLRNSPAAPTNSP